MSSTDRTSAVTYLRSRDRVLREVIDAVGPFAVKLERKRFAMLVRSIISQQISTGAARSIRRRLEELVAPAAITEASISQLSLDELRAAGLSASKANYLLDLAQCVSRGDVNLHRIGRLSNEQVIDELTRVKGIGRWTAQMFLIFSLGRLDVFPHGDLGVRSAIRNLYGFDELPNKEQCLEIAEPWSPYESVASWYCWRSIDMNRK